MQLYFYNGQSTNYSITTDGKLYNNSTKKWLKGQVSKNGYLTYNITLNNGEKKRLYAHRMVMMTFSPVENMDKLEVNHIDTNKLNNSIDNLEWTTSSQNKQHAIEHGLYDAKRKKVFCFDQNKNIVATYETLSDAVSILGISYSGLSSALNREKASLFNGYYWRFSNEDFEIEKIQLSNKKKKVGKYSLENELLESYESMAAAARENNLDRPNISKCCNGHIHTYGGFIWKFL